MRRVTQGPCKFLFAAVLAGLTLSAHAVDAAESFKLIRSPEVSAMAADGQPLGIFDANNADTRAKYGSVPGAVLLPSSSDYPAQLLPADKAQRVVFYCANELCTASHTAAERASANGYRNVYVMADGIQGWAKSGRPTSPAIKPQAAG